MGSWLLVVLILIAIEMATTNLTTIWFVVSGLIAMILSTFSGISFEIQFSVFVIVGVLLLITTRPLLNRLLKHKTSKTNIDRIIGMNGIVTEEIQKNKVGEVKVDGKLWSAVADKTIKKDTIVKVLEINSVKIKVEEVNE